MGIKGKGYLSSLVDNIICTAVIDGKEEKITKLFNASRGNKVFVLRLGEGRQGGNIVEYIYLMDDTFVHYEVW